MKYRTNRRKQKKHRQTKRKVQRGGFSLNDIWGAIGLQATKDEKKIKGALADLVKLYEGYENKYKEGSPADVALTELIKDLKKNNNDFDAITTKIDNFNAMKKDPTNAPLNNKSIPTPMPTPIPTPTPTPTPTPAKPSIESGADPEKDTNEEEQTRIPLDKSPPRTGGKKSKKRKHKKSKKHIKKTKKSPKSNKHYNQRGGTGCSQLITPAKVNAFQGPPWTGKVTSWPGVGGVAGQTNYLKLNTLKNQPDRYPDMVSGIYT